MHVNRARPSRETTSSSLGKSVFYFFSAELPPVVAVDAGHERGHGLVGAPRLQLVVRALALLALAALERVRGGFLALPADGFVRGVLADGFVFGSSLRGGELFRGELE